MKNEIIAQAWEKAQRILTMSDRADEYLNLFAEIKPISYNPETKELHLDISYTLEDLSSVSLESQFVFYAIYEAFGRDTHIFIPQQEKEFKVFFWELDFMDYKTLIKDCSPEDLAYLEQLEPVFMYPLLQVFKTPQYLMYNQKVRELLFKQCIPEAVLICDTHPENMLETEWALALDDYRLWPEHADDGYFIQELHPVSQSNQVLRLRADSYAAYYRLCHNRYLQYCLLKNIGFTTLLVEHPVHRENSTQLETDAVDLYKFFAGKEKEEECLKDCQKVLQDIHEIVAEKVRNGEPFGLETDPIWCNDYWAVSYPTVTPARMLEILEKTSVSYVSPDHLYVVEYRGDDIFQDETGALNCLRAICWEFCPYSIKLINQVIIRG